MIAFAIASIYNLSTASIHLNEVKCSLKKGQLSWDFVLFARCAKKQDKCFTISLKKIQLHVWKKMTKYVAHEYFCVVYSCHSL